MRMQPRLTRFSVAFTLPRDQHDQRISTEYHRTEDVNLAYGLGKIICLWHMYEFACGEFDIIQNQPGLRHK